MDSYLYILIPVMFVLIFPLFFCGVIFLISRFAWARFASEFATDYGKPSDGQSASFQALRFGPLFFGANYNNIVTIAASREGLFLAPSIFLFRVGHRDLLIPWKKIDAVTRGKSLWFDTNALEVRGGYPTITIYRPIGNAVRERWEAETRSPETRSQGRA
jgi:hypothetical protein